MTNIHWEISPCFVAYNDALTKMEREVAAIASGNAPEKVWLLEHPSIYTAGTSAKETDLLNPGAFPVYQVGRGGQYTYHGPGQRVAYVMLDLKKRQCQDVRRYVTNLEEWLILALAEFGVKGEIREGRVGVWVNHKGTEKKIAALGVRIKKWVTFHGVALNVCLDLTHYQGIVPCGIQEYGVTSLQELGIDVSMQQVDAVLKRSFDKIFH